MIKLGKLTDYAIVILGEISRGREEGPLSAHVLSDKTGLPEPTVSKILKLLTKKGLIASQRGSLGGYSLTRTAKMISMADIITAMEGPIALVACVEGSPENCRVDTVCCMKGRWDKVNRAVKQALESVSLDEMTSGNRPIVSFVEMKQA